MTRPRLRAVLRIALLLAVVAWPAPAAADEKPVVAYWLAATSHGGNIQWGRLVMKDGTLAFFTTEGTWETPLAEITRISRVRGSQQFQIATASGSVLQLSILGPQMVPQPPQKAMQMIQRAIKDAAGVSATVALRER